MQTAFDSYGCILSLVFPAMRDRAGGSVFQGRTTVPIGGAVRTVIPRMVGAGVARQGRRFPAKEGLLFLFLRFFRLFFRLFVERCGEVDELLTVGEAHDDDAAGGAGTGGDAGDGRADDGSALGDEH